MQAMLDGEGFSFHCPPEIKAQGLDVNRLGMFPLRSSGSMLGGLGASVAMLDEAVLSRRAN